MGRMWGWNDRNSQLPSRFLMEIRLEDSTSTVALSGGNQLRLDSDQGEVHQISFVFLWTVQLKYWVFCRTDLWSNFLKRSITSGDVTSHVFTQHSIRHPSSNHAVASYSNQPTAYMLWTQKKHGRNFDCHVLVVALNHRNMHGQGKKGFRAREKIENHVSTDGITRKGAEC